MNLSATLKKILFYIKSADLIFLIFLLLVLNVSIIVKLSGIAFLYICRFNFKFGFRNGQLPWFYLSIICLALLQFLINYKYWSTGYAFLSLICIIFWSLSLLINHQLKFAIERSGVERINKALTLFFILNAVVSFLNILRIIFEIKVLNPYTYEGMNLKYHVSTGDWIMGITMDFSLTNSFISILGLIYFLYNQKYILSFICLAVVLLATSNASIILLIIAFFFIILFDRNRLNKSIVICFIGAIIVFFAKISPQNTTYSARTLGAVSDHNTASGSTKQADSVIQAQKTYRENLLKYASSKNKHLSNASKVIPSREKENKIIAAIEEIKNIEKRESKKINEQQKETHNEKQEKLQVKVIDLYHDTVLQIGNEATRKYPGKLISFIETKDYVLSNVRTFLLGSGAGLFSSKVAFKASNIGDFGKYPVKFSFISENFKNNHLKIYCYYFLQSLDKHSITNTPFSVFNQITGEYGLAGLLLFLVFYVWFFLKRYKQLSYGKIILPLTLVFLFTDYWFENLSIVIIFELMMFMDIATSKKSSENA